LKNRKASFVVLGGAALVAALAGGGWVAFHHQADSAQIAAGQAVYSAHCASCHGANLEGQPDWQTRLPNGRMPAPPHDVTGHTWHHSDDQLFTILKKGVSAIVPDYESDMPAFQGVLTDDEVRAVLEDIKSTWPEREREVQVRRSGRS
jgi:mono/diheme cytochrome c family protein